MPKVTPEELERLRLVAERAEARFKQKKQQRRYQERKDETRAKIITGGAFADAIRDETVDPSLLPLVLNRYVTNAKDREFLKLPPLEETSTAEPDDQGASTENHPLETQEDNQNGDLFGNLDFENLADFDHEDRG